MYDKVLVIVSQVERISVSNPIWTIVTLEGYETYHGSRPQGPYPWVGLDVKLFDTFKN